MFCTYAIKSTTRNDIYVGLTDNLVRRFNEHQVGKNKTTKPCRPFKLIYSELHDTWETAMGREKYVRSGIGKAFLKFL